MEIAFGISGVLGGILCAIGDVLVDYAKGEHERLGKYKYIESNWTDIAIWRLKLSVLFAAAGVPLYFLGLTSLAMQMENKQFALIFWIICLIGSTGGFFIHAMICVFPILYQKVKADRTFEETENILNTAYEAINIPFIIQFICLVIISSILIGFAIIRNYLSLPIWMILLTPLCMAIIGNLLRLIKKAWFNNFPGIVMPSLGLSMIGFMAIVNYF